MSENVEVLRRWENAKWRPASVHPAAALRGGEELKYSRPILFSDGANGYFDYGIRLYFYNSMFSYSENHTCYINEEKLIKLDVKWCYFPCRKEVDFIVHSTLANL